ncbi:DCL family protein [Nostoc sp. CALU 1950]|uniref:DCL family protein n=1 Tax=Nostoc sp. CALU 1950 TaxID=3104321 RepID=UPI003EC13A69
MLAKPSELGGFHFKTQKERDNYIKSVLSRGIRVLESQEASVVYDLLLLHPEVDSKIGIGIKQIEVRESPQRKNKCFWVIREDGSTVDFSAEKCKYNMSRLIEKRRKSAYREAVGGQTGVYLKQRGSSQVCDICGLSNELHVDHHKPLFSKLISDFEKDRTGIPTEFQEATGTYFSKQFCKDDKEYRESWCSYHQQHAVLRLLCREHNLTSKRK